MRRGVWLFLWISALRGPIVGCNEVTVSDTASLELTVVSLSEPLGEAVALEDALLCPADTSQCERTDANGIARIELPIGEKTSFTLEEDDHVSVLVPVVMRSASVGSRDDVIVMRTHDYMAAQFEHLGDQLAYPMRGTGAIRVTRFRYEAGATFELHEATGRKFYDDDEGWWSFDLDATTKVGLGGFVDVTPGGPYQIQAGGSAEGCSVWWGWPGEDDDMVSFSVRENYLTELSVICNQSP